KKLEEIRTYEEFYEEQYGRLHDYYVELCVDAQCNSYKLLNENVAFLYNSILMDGCLEKGKALLDGGVKYLGGCCETYGNINCSDSLYAIKKLVFDDKKYTLREINNALLADFEGYEKMRKDMLACAKYGNDMDEVDEIAVECYNRVAQGIRKQGIEKGLHYYGIVIINNEANTKWGLRTSASADGRKNLVYLNPSNNPQGGADKNGPTAMLNSLVKLPVKWHVGSVQNIKFQKNFFMENMEILKTLFKTYFKNGGCQLMVTVVDSGALEDAMIHPEKYPDLIVRVSGFSAVFVNLRKETQQELLSRTLYDSL
ncbi:MAG: pyruvate formate-lyase, partial [Lachnospiraceae bacterium]|nr:pyruvate formate-lyase [Lachnospiraceae bacterium]